MSNNLHKKIAALLAELPVLPGQKERLPNWTRFLEAAITITKSRNFIQLQRKGSAKKELLAAHQATRKLIRSTNEIGADAWLLLETELAASDAKTVIIASPNSRSSKLVNLPKGGPASLHIIRLRLGELERALGRAFKSATGDQIKTGRPPNIRARRVSDAAAQAYEALTGEDAVRIIDGSSGASISPFVTLLDKLFCVAGIKANADEQVRLMGKTPQNNRPYPH